MIYYLVQGEAYQYADRMAEMANSGAEVIFLTWDKPVDGALFLPDSSIMQGRNFLLQHVLKNKYKFEHLVFIDGDAKPIKGSWRDFNHFLLSKKPQICVPLIPKTSNLLHVIFKRLHIPIQLPIYQRALTIDSQVLAFRKDVIDAASKVIYPIVFDQINWYYNDGISHHILRYLVPYNIIQFNRLEIQNNSHSQYPKKLNDDYITNYLKKLNLPTTLLPFFAHRMDFYQLRKILNSFVEIFYLIPFPIKKFDVAKRAMYIKQCLQKMETINIPESKKEDDCINT